MNSSTNPTFDQWLEQNGFDANQWTPELKAALLVRYQRSMVAAKLATLKDGRPSKTSSNDGVSSRDGAATLLNVSTASVDRAKQVIEHGSKEVLIAPIACQWPARCYRVEA